MEILRTSSNTCVPVTRLHDVTTATTQMMCHQPVCSSVSDEETRMQFICNTFELTRKPVITDSPAMKNTNLTNDLEQLISEQFQKNAAVTIHKTYGDGNCLFRAISFGLTQSQEAHHLIRNYTVNHMPDKVFSCVLPENVDEIANMGREGVWGTDRNIAALQLSCSRVT